MLERYHSTDPISVPLSRFSRFSEMFRKYSRFDCFLRMFRLFYLTHSYKWRENFTVERSCWSEPVLLSVWIQCIQKSIQNESACDLKGTFEWKTSDCGSALWIWKCSTSWFSLHSSLQVSGIKKLTKKMVIQFHTPSSPGARDQATNGLLSLRSPLSCIYSL